jgi:molybdopterin converting factor small subunit
MIVRVQFFARLRDLAGTAEAGYEVPVGATVHDLLAVLYRATPALQEWDAHLLTAVGVEYVPRDFVLLAETTLLLFPPVQGG